MVIPSGALSGTCEVSEKKSEDRYSGKSLLRLQKQACLAQIEKCSHSDNFQREFTEEALDTNFKRILLVKPWWSKHVLITALLMI